MASEAWQIGSLSPPTVCLCCGSKFDDEVHKIKGPYETGPYRYVCEWCWKKSYMFFPDKEVRGSYVVPPFDPTEITEGAPTLQLDIASGNSLNVRLINVPIHALRLNPDNPRLGHSTGREESEVEEWLWRETGTKNLYNEIRYSGGLSEKPIVDYNFTVIEGNRRIVCLRKLDAQAKNGELPGFSDSAFEKTQCFMLPGNAQPRDVSLLVSRIHVSGKKEWSPLSQAEQIFEMVTKYGTPMKEIGSALSISPRKAEVMLRAFEATLEYGRTNTDIERKWIHKFSYFYELFRDKSLRSWASNPENLRTFSSLISGINPKIALGNQVRRLAVILMDPQAFSILQSEGFDKAYARVNRRKSRNDPDGKLLEAFETMVKISNGSIRLTRKRIDVLLDIKLYVHQILSKDPKP